MGLPAAAKRVMQIVRRSIYENQQGGTLMDEIARRIEHIKTVLSSEELRVLCFDLEIDYDHLIDDDSEIFASNLLSYLQEENQLETLMDMDYFFDESMAKGLSPDAVQRIALHTEMMISNNKNEVIKLCKEIPLYKWEDHESLDDRDFYREVILLAKRRGYLPKLEETFFKADSLDSLDWLLAINTELSNLNPKQREGFILWMKNQASINDLAHLGFLMGRYDNIETSFMNSEKWVNWFVDYFERRNRLGQVAAIKVRFWDQ